METVSRGTSPLEPWYVTGFCDGGASFTYSRSGRQLNLYFAIKLGEVDRPVLERFQEFFGTGRIYASRAGAKIGAYFRVSDRRGLARVVEHFDEYPLRSAKQTSYSVWRKMVLMKQAFRSYSRDELNDLAEQLSAIAARK